MEGASPLDSCSLLEATAGLSEQLGGKVDGDVRVGVLGAVLGAHVNATLAWLWLRRARLPRGRLLRRGRRVPRVPVAGVVPAHASAHSEHRRGQRGKGKSSHRSHHPHHLLAGGPRRLSKGRARRAGPIDDREFPESVFKIVSGVLFS